MELTFPQLIPDARITAEQVEDGLKKTQELLC